MQKLKDIFSIKNTNYDFDALHLNRKMNREVAKENILSLKYVFDKFEIDFWLCFGTLLGAVREGNFIEHDKDTDIGVYYEQKYRIVNALKELIDEGFEIIRITENEELITILRNKEYIDLYLFKKHVNNNIWDCLGYKIDGDYFNDFNRISFFDHSFKAPANLEGYLETVYGQDWKVPKIDAHAQPVNVLEEIYKEYYLLLNRWLEMNMNNKYLYEKLQFKNIDKIIVYGYGELGKRIIQDIERSSIDILGIIDKNLNQLAIKEYELYSLEDIGEMNNVAIIVTPFYYLDFIKEEILYFNNKLEVLGLNELV